MHTKFFFRSPQSGFAMDVPISLICWSLTHSRAKKAKKNHSLLTHNQTELQLERASKEIRWQNYYIQKLFGNAEQFVQRERTERTHESFKNKKERKKERKNRKKNQRKKQLICFTFLCHGQSGWHSQRKHRMLIAETYSQMGKGAGFTNTHAHYFFFHSNLVRFLSFLAELATPCGSCSVYAVETRPLHSHAIPIPYMLKGKQKKNIIRKHNVTFPITALLPAKNDWGTVQSRIERVKRT